jgi:hypothetical protein
MTGEKTTLNQVLKWIVLVFVYGYGFTGLVNIYKARHTNEHFKGIYKPHYLFAQIFFYVFAMFTMTMA